MPTEQRTLEIIAKARDQASRIFQSIGRNFVRVVRFSFIAPLRVLQASLRLLRSLFLSLGAAALGAFAFIRGGQSALGVIETADAMSKLARATGASTESITTLRAAMEFGGIQGEKFRIIMTGLARSVSQSLRLLRGPQFDAFQRLGVGLDVLRAGDPTEIFAGIARGLEEFNSEAEKAALLQAIFPDNFLKLLPLLGQGEKAFRANAEAARQFGAAMSGEAGKAAEEFNDEMNKLRIALAAVARDGILGLAKELLPMVKGFAVWISQNREALIPIIEAVVRLLVQLVLIVAKLALEIVLLVQQGFGPLLDKLREAGILGGALADVLAALGESLGLKALSGDARDAQRELEEAASRVALLESALARLQSVGGREAAPGIARVTAELEEARKNLASAADRVDSTGFDQRGDTQRGALDVARLREFLEQVSSGNFLDELKRLGEGSIEIFRAEAEEAGEIIEENTQQSQGFFASFAAGIAAASTEWRNFGKAALDAGRTILDSGLSALSSGLTEVILGTKSAKEAFRDLAKSILQEIARIIPRLLLVRLLSGVFGVSLAEGGVTPGLQATIPLRRFAHGGVAREPTLGIFGEAGEEAFVPLRSGRIPVRIEGGGGAGPFIFAPTISAMDGRSVKRVLIEERQTLVSIWQHELQRTQTMKRGLREQVR